jgi:hypothetical protein
MIKLKLLLFLCLTITTGANDEAVLKSAIKNFSNDIPNAVSLGSYMVVDSDSVTTVLSFKDKAIPELTEALKSNDPLIVAQSAYCLECLKAKDSLPEIQSAWIKFNTLPKPRKAVNEYALERIEGYLRAAKNDFKG